MQPIAPQPVNTNAQGVGSVAPVAPPTPTATPAAPAPQAAPAAAPPQSLNSGTMDALANYYQIPRDTAQVVNAGQVAANGAAQQVQAASAGASAAAAHAKAALDPSSYTFAHNRDGSLTIFNSAGDKVDIGTYASLTGANPADVLSKEGATDQGSQKFVQAYNNLQTYVQNKIGAQNGDQKAQAAVDQFTKANPGLEKLQLGQLQESFMQEYGSYFGQQQNASKYNQLGNAPNVSKTLSSANDGTSSNSLSALYSALGVTPQGQ